MNQVLPSELLQFAAEMNNIGEDLGHVAVDTETSGLFEDDGARVSAASVAFRVPSKGVMHEVVERWSTEGRITLKTEQITNATRIHIASVAWPFDQGLAGTGKPEDHGQASLWEEAPNLPLDEWNSLLAFLRYAGEWQGLVMHNSKFDCHKFRVGCRPWPGVGVDLMNYVVADTQNTNAQLWPLEPTSLKPTCARLFGQEFADESEKVKEYLRKSKLPSGRWDLIPWDIVGPYADMDARLTLMLHTRQMIEASNMLDYEWTQFGDLSNRRLKTTRVLYSMEKKGLPYDEVASRLAGDECMKRAEQIAKQLPFSPPTITKAVDYWFGEDNQGLVPYGMTPGGKPQLTAEIVDKMVADGVEHARTWAEYQKVTKAASMWYFGYADAIGPDGRLRTSFRQNGTRSSRFSVERVNLQAIPADYRLSGYDSLDGIPTPRQLITAGVPQGWRIWELDLAQAELRVGALYSKCTPMLDMMAEGADLHDYTTRNLFNMDKDHPDWGKYRQVGKRANFSLGFGSGWQTFMNMVSKETGITLGERESRRIVGEWNGLFPQWKDAIQRHMTTVIERQKRFGQGWVKFENGERRWFQKYEEAHKAFNQRVQGNLAQFGIDWMLTTHSYLSQIDQLEIGGGGLILTIHDSQVLLLPDNEDGNVYANTCAQFATDLWKHWFPGVGGGSEAKAWKVA